MGYLITHGWTFSDVIKDRIKDESNEVRDIKTLKHCLRGNVLWTVVEITKKETNEKIRFIGCDLLRKDRDGAGYKDMDESMGPCYYSCPLSFFELVPVVNQEWRNSVKAYHEKRKIKFTLNQIVSLNYCVIPYVKIVNEKPLWGRYNGTTYRINKNSINTIMDEKSMDISEIEKCRI